MDSELFGHLVFVLSKYSISLDKFNDDTTIEVVKGQSQGQSCFSGSSGSSGILISLKCF